MNHPKYASDTLRGILSLDAQCTRGGTIVRERGAVTFSTPRSLHPKVGSPLAALSVADQYRAAAGAVGVYAE